ncbi:MAG: DNA polymerase III subunit beta family protein [Sulfobacillus sp.]
MLTIPLKALKALLITAPKSEARHILNGVHFKVRNEDTLYAACDGHRATVYRQENWGHPMPDPVPAMLGEGILPRDYCEQIARLASPLYDIQIAIVYGEYGRPTARHVQSGLTAALIDGRYPDYMKVIPREFSGETAQFNSAYVADIAKICKAMGQKHPYAHITHNGEGTALVRFADPNLIQALAPMRSQPQDGAFPDWLDEAEAATDTTEAPETAAPGDTATPEPDATTDTTTTAAA